MKKGKILLTALVLTSTLFAAPVLMTSCGGGNDGSQSVSLNENQSVAQSILKQALTLTTTDKGTFTNDFTLQAFVNNKSDGQRYDLTITSSDTNVCNPVLSSDKATYNIAVTRPAVGEKDAVVTLTASVTYNGETMSKTITVTISACQETNGLENIAACFSLFEGKDDKNNLTEAFAFKNNLTVVGYCAEKGVVLADESALLYVFSSDMVSKTKVGDKVSVSEAKGYRYYGLPEVSSITYEVVSHGNPLPNTAATQTTIAEIAGFASKYETGYKIPVEKFVKYKATAKVVYVEGSDSVLLVDPNDSTKFILGYKGFADLDNLKVISGKTVEVTFAIYDEYKNYSQTIGGDYGNPSNGIRFIYCGDTPELDYASMTDEEKATMAETEVKLAVKDVPTSFTEEKTVTLPSSVTEGLGATITWALDEEADTAAYTLDATKNELKVTPTETESAAKLTGTIKVGSVTKTVELDFTAKVVSATVVKGADLKADTAYKFAVVNPNNAASDGKPMFLTGEKSGNFFATSTDIGKAADVKLVQVSEGKYYLEVEGTTKKYVNITVTVSTKTSFKYDFGTTGTTEWQIDTEHDTLYSIDSETSTKFYLGTYSTYDTISASEFTANIDRDGSCHCNFYTVE